MVKIGDKVRFLSEQGGGRVTGFQNKNIVLVEDSDGFEIPFPINEVVVVDNDNYDRNAAGVSAQKQVEHKKNNNVEEHPEEKEITFKHPVEERKGGESLSVYLAFVPIDIKEVSKTKFEAYLVNDCNYYIRFTYLSSEGNTWKLRSTGEIEPNTKLYLEEFERDILNELNRVCIQFVAYKRDKNFILKPSAEAQFRIDAVKFYKLHTFKENDFFETPALIYPVIENDQIARPLVVDAKSLKREMYTNNDADKSNAAVNNDYVRRYEDGKKQGNPFISKHKNDDIAVVDLHAHELLETTAGMNATDILNYQLDVFRKTLDKYKNNKGKKIVFIHGKGEGVLRHAIIHELNYRFKRYTYQDASFQEYGYGATQVTIH